MLVVGALTALAVWSLGSARRGIRAVVALLAGLIGTVVGILRAQRSAMDAEFCGWTQSLSPGSRSAMGVPGAQPFLRWRLKKAMMRRLASWLAGSSYLVPEMRARNLSSRVWSCGLWLFMKPCPTPG